MKRKKKTLSVRRTTLRNLTEAGLTAAVGGSSGQGSQSYRANGRMILGFADPTPPPTVSQN